MPNTKSAKKRSRQNLERRTRNRTAKATIKTEIRKAREAAKSGNAEATASALKLVAKKADQAVARGIIHKNASSRIKSRLSAFVKATKQPAAKAAAK